MVIRMIKLIIIISVGSVVGLRTCSNTGAPSKTKPGKVRFNSRSRSIKRSNTQGRVSHDYTVGAT